MLRDASMIAAAPRPVPPPYETVPSYAIGQTRMRDLSKLENSSSAMPPKFRGRDCDSVMYRSLAKSKEGHKKAQKAQKTYPLSFCASCAFLWLVVLFLRL